MKKEINYRVGIYCRLSQDDGNDESHQPVLQKRNTECLGSGSTVLHCQHRPTRRARHQVVCDHHQQEQNEDHAVENIFGGHANTAFAKEHDLRTL